MRVKLVAIFLCLLMLTGMMLGAASAEEQTAHMTVVATVYPLYDMARQIGGEHVNVVYQPEATAEDVEGANILLCMGGERDAWAEELKDVTVLRAMDGIELIEGETNVLTIPVNNMLAASYFVDTLCAADEAHGEAYKNNFSAYTEGFIALDMRFRNETGEGAKVFCEDGSMAYFAKEYGVEIADAAEGAAVLKTYEHPAEEDLEVPYIELMQRNLEALTNAE